MKDFDAIRRAIGVEAGVAGMAGSEEGGEQLLPELSRSEELFGDFGAPGLGGKDDNLVGDGRRIFVRESPEGFGEDGRGEAADSDKHGVRSGLPLAGTGPSGVGWSGA